MNDTTQTPTTLIEVRTKEQEAKEARNRLREAIRAGCTRLEDAPTDYAFVHHDGSAAATSTCQTFHEHLSANAGKLMLTVTVERRPRFYTMDRRQLHDDDYRYWPRLRIGRIPHEVRPQLGGDGTGFGWTLTYRHASKENDQLACVDIPLLYDPVTRTVMGPDLTPIDRVQAVLIGNEAVLRFFETSRLEGGRSLPDADVWAYLACMKTLGDRWPARTERMRAHVAARHAKAIEDTRKIRHDYEASIAQALAQARTRLQGILRDADPLDLNADATYLEAAGPLIQNV